MPGSHWLITVSPENYSITRDMHYSLLGLRGRHRKKGGTRRCWTTIVLYYVIYERIFPKTADCNLGLTSRTATRRGSTVSAKTIHSHIECIPSRR